MRGERTSPGRAELAAAALDLGLVARVEAHSVRAWPSAICEVTPGGWALRATPGLDRGRSNHALTPCRPLSAAEVAAGVASVEAFAARHGVRPGIQVSPLEFHGELLAGLISEGWEPQWSVAVLAARPRDVAAAGPRLDLIVEDRASDEWLAAWAVCEPGRDIESHARTVFPLLAGAGRFVRYGERAVGIAVEFDGLVGLFCLAVAPAVRRRGLGQALVRGMLAGCRRETDLAYLQVQESNTAGLALYDRLRFERLYRYRHCVAPRR